MCTQKVDDEIKKKRSKSWVHPSVPMGTHSIHNFLLKNEEIVWVPMDQRMGT